MKCVKCAVTIPDDSIYCNMCGAKQQRNTSHGRKSRGNGQGCVYKEANGTYTAIASKLIGGKQHRRVKKGFIKKKDAIAYLPSLRFDPEFDPSNKITFDELYEQWSEGYYKKLSKSKETSYRTAHKNCSQLYYRDWSSITLREMQDVVDMRPSYYTRKDVKQLMTAMGDYAVRNEYCEKNRARMIVLPQLERTEKEAFTVDEIQRLWADYRQGNKFTAYALVMIYTGLRYGEMKNIIKENVNFEQQYMTGGIKTEAGKNRIIPITDAILPLVQEMYDTHKSRLLEMHEQTFRVYFAKMTERAGVRPLKPHSCRHTFCSQLAIAGVQPGVIQKVAGHASYSTTAIYTHIQQLTDSLAAVDRMAINIANSASSENSGENS